MKNSKTASRSSTHNGINTACNKNSVNGTQKEINALSVNIYDSKAAVHELAFLGHASLSTCVAPQRMLVVHEDPTNGIYLIGTNTS